MRWARIAAVVAAAAEMAGLAARADDASAWLMARQVRFIAYRADHPGLEAQIARIRARTSALVAAAAPFGAAATESPPIIWRVLPEPLELWDGPQYPEMIVVPAGEFAMGSPPGEADRDPREDPRHRVRIGYSFAVSKYPVTVGEFARFVADTGYDAGDWCHTDEPGPQPKTGRNWRDPGFAQTFDHPVTCVSSLDAQAYAAWLSRRTGHLYRLLSEAEYEYVNRAGTETAYWWGDDPDAACAYADGPDLDTQAVFPAWAAHHCHDGYAFTAPVGRFKPNPFGLYDTTGNVWSWLADCYTAGYAGAPADGAADMTGDCKWRRLRGGAWGRYASYLRAARRGRDLVANRIYNNGFRLARRL